MTIDTSGQWWRGEDFSDLADYLRALTADGCPVVEIHQARCTCGSTTFELWADREAGCALRVCAVCGERAFLGDSAEHWVDATPTQVRCPCGAAAAELAVGFARRGDGEIRWLTVGERCTRCGVLASGVDWEIDYAPTGHLVQQV